MPGLGIRLWNPPGKGIGVENPMTVINTTVADPIALDGTTIPFRTYTGNFLLRIVGRQMNASPRPLPITVKWNNIPMVQQALFCDSGSGGAFVGMWSLINQTPANADIVITCGTNNAGCAAIRVGEIAGKPVPVAANARAGYSVPYTMTASALVVAGGCSDETAFPFSSPDFDTQYGVMIPKKIALPNRHNGMTAYFGSTFSAAADGVYDILPKVPITGVIGLFEIRLTA